jgi:gliding motility-associated-like protein
MVSFKLKKSEIALSIFHKKILIFFFFLAPLFCFCQNIELYKQYNGKYDYKAFGNTLNISPNSCNIQTQSSAVFNLSPSQNLISAYLYWSGSGGLINDTFPGDYEVNLNGITVSAERTFINNLQDNKFYGAFADVTSILNNFGNGTYTVSNFDLTGNIFPGSPYCNNQTDFGGWTITVVYQDNSLPLNQVNLFDGFESVSQFNNNLTIQLTTLNVMDNMGAKIGFLAWEGDASLDVNETLRINGNILSNPPLNPQTNAFNGTNSFTNSSQLYNMDIDFYNIENYIQPGDVSATISLTSGQDYIIVNNIITVLNSELPDATISFENIEIICNNLVEINYTVFNINSTGILPAGTPIKFYLEGNQIGQAFTDNDLPIDGQETGSITLTIPIDTVPDPFTIKVVVDDGGGGISTVTEINEDNNEFEQIISLAEVVLNLTLDADILITNDDAICEGEDQVIGINSLTPPIAAGENSTYQWFFNGTLMPGETDEQLTVNQTGTYQLEVTYEGCIVTDDILVEFIINPIAGTPTPLIECDQTPNDGIAEFNLTEADNDIINGQTNNFVTYHETLAQAEAGTDALVSPYTNTVPNIQTIFARLEEDVLGCYDVIQLVLQVDPAPSITDPISDYQLCDNDGDGSETFDLTSKYDEIVNTLTDVTLTYYNTQADANADTNAIATPSAYISSGAETIWVRAINTEGCISVGFFNLIIDTVPLFTEVPLFQICDDTTPDGFTEFDLDSLYPTIVAGASNLTVSYYLTEEDAEAGAVSPLSSPYTNTINPELIWARVEDDITGCFGTFVIELNVISPIAGTPTPLIECDQTPNDGIAEFNLTEADNDIINGQTNNFVTYHETLAQAEAGTDALVSPYTNTVPNIQTIFARLEEDVLGCYDVIQLVLQVDPAPSITDPISDYQLCDNDGDGSETFDLTSKYDEIVNTLTDVTLTYYNTQADANADTNAIATPSAYISSGAETIWVRAINTEGCSSVGFFNLIIDTVPLFTEVPLFQICDDTTPDGFTEFDLDSLYPTIVAGASNLTVSYYLTEEDAEAGAVSPLSSPYTNTINPELIWARVEDDIAGCYGTFVIELNVISPLAGTPTPLIECDQTPNDGIAEFNLTEADNDIINGQTNNFVTYHETLAQAEAGTDALLSPYTNTVPNIQTIFARLEEDVLSCYDVIQLVLQVDPAPSITDPISDYQLCDNDGDGSETFDLTSKYDEIVNTLTDVTLTYYNTQADADVDTNAIVTPSAYISSGTETIWVRLSDNFTQCYTIGNFQIETIFCPLPDATVSINNDLYACRNRDLIIEYRVNNIDGTAILPAFTPISFYLDEILVTQTQTLNDIPINGSEINSIEINLPINTPNLFEILIRVDDLGFSEGIIEELDELNNEYSVSIEFGSLPPILPLSNLIECDEGNESANFNLTQQNNSISTNTNDIITFYVSEEDANLNENEITDTGNYQNTSNPQTIYIRLENEICFTTSSFEIETENCIPFIPEGFSPNNDNINDVFEIDHLLNVYLDFELKIFSRYGNIIYKGTHEDGFWDGISNEGITFKHQLVPTGVYIYVLQLNDYRYPDSFIGTVYINY